MDVFASLFDHFAPTARCFFSGNLCEAFAFEKQAEAGYLHVLRNGQLRVQTETNAPVDLHDPALLFMPRNIAHSFEPDPESGADLVCATVQIGGGQGNPLFASLPDLTVVPFKQIKTIAPTLDLLMAEAFDGLSGRQVALDRLFEYLMVQLVRYLIDAKQVSAGALAGLADPRLSRAMAAIHDAPARVWTLDDLAASAGMSRTRFAAHFRDVVGTTPIDYLTRWRITVAQALLRKRKPIKNVAHAVGYDSPAAMARAFAKITGMSPRAWQAQQVHSAG